MGEPTMARCVTIERSRRKMVLPVLDAVCPVTVQTGTSLTILYTECLVVAQAAALL